MINFNLINYVSDVIVEKLVMKCFTHYIAREYYSKWAEYTIKTNVSDSPLLKIVRQDPLGGTSTPLNISTYSAADSLSGEAIKDALNSKRKFFFEFLLTKTAQM